MLSEKCENAACYVCVWQILLSGVSMLQFALAYTPIYYVAAWAVDGHSQP